jgi:hypothetical protein
VENPVLSELDYVIFSSAQMGKSSNLVTGFKIPLTSQLDEPGVVAIAGTSIDFDSYPNWQKAPPSFRKTTTENFAIIAGQWRSGRAWTTFGIGPEFVNIRTQPNDLFNKMNGYRTGIRFIGDLWYDINSQYIFQLTVVGSSAANRIWMRSYLGFKVAEKLMIGPEYLSTFEPSFREYGAGISLAYKLWNGVNVNFSLGFLHDNKEEIHKYVKIEFVYKK